VRATSTVTIYRVFDLSGQVNLTVVDNVEDIEKLGHLFNDKKK
jgi:hypothetical protein